MAQGSLEQNLALDLLQACFRAYEKNKIKAYPPPPMNNLTNPPSYWLNLSLNSIPP